MRFGVVMQAVVQLLLAAGGDLNAVDSLGCCALLDAIRGKHMGCIQLLKGEWTTPNGQ